jgi:hypothetical protein
MATAAVLMEYAQEENRRHRHYRRQKRVVPRAAGLVVGAKNVSDKTIDVGTTMMMTILRYTGRQKVMALSTRSS